MIVLPAPGSSAIRKPDAGLGKQMAIDGIHLVRQGIDLRHGDREVRVVLVGQADAMGLGGQPEMGRIAVQGRQVPRQRELDRRRRIPPR